MSWSDGVDLVALSAPGLPAPNVIVHFAAMVHTPAGSAPAGMILIPEEINPAQPRIFGFVCADEAVGAYFGPRVFAGTPFERAPVLKGNIEIELALARHQATVRIFVAGLLIENTLSGLGALGLVDRAAGRLPFHERALEAAATAADLRVNGKPFPVILPPAGMSGGPAAAYAATGFYAR